ncbi:MAG: ATP-binding protein [Bacteroidales bacterium]|nr:ATP-binding protein [Bacteroidales bacterium]
MSSLTRYKKTIMFQNVDRNDWLKIITDTHDEFQKSIGNLSGQNVMIDFDTSIIPKDIRPFHLVTLACLIHFMKNHGLKVHLSKHNEAMFNYIYNDLGFSEYWRGGKDHVDAPGYESIFNLWRITEEGKDLYAPRVEKYLKQTYFIEKDLSAISVGLVEAYYNVFDHAYADGNAFSLIQFDDETSILYVAISDFGIGIAKSVRDYDKSITTDKDAILKALEDNFTIKSTTRNKGMGLSNILAPAKEARIFSHTGLVYKHDNVTKGFDCDMSYPGTLIYYEIDLSQMENEEIITEFDFFN